MLDLKFIRENPELVRDALESRHESAPLKEILKIFLPHILFPLLMMERKGPLVSNYMSQNLRKYPFGKTRRAINLIVLQILAQVNLVE